MNNYNNNKDGTTMQSIQTLTAKKLLESPEALEGLFVMETEYENISFGKSTFNEHKITIYGSNLGELDFTGFNGFVEFIDCHIKKIIMKENINSSKIRKAPFKIVESGIDGITVHAKVDGELEMRKNKFNGITDFSDS